MVQRDPPTCLVFGKRTCHAPRDVVLFVLLVVNVHVSRGKSAVTCIYRHLYTLPNVACELVWIVEFAAHRCSELQSPDGCWRPTHAVVGDQLTVDVLPTSVGW